MKRTPTVWAGLVAATLATSPLGSACERAQPPAAVPEPAGPEGESNPRLPGFESSDPSLQADLERRLRDKGPDYAPRTHHLHPDGRPKFINRLIRESSPYLLQHAHNPVSWYPWSDEAFARAKRENKPIFLSVGYSTCHWCHVMERESFEDEEIAAFLNRHFIAIKVDREERPDVDSVYMTAVNMLVGRGGWPMTVIMTPDKEPFFGGTYFPPRRGVRGARAGLIDILAELSERYRRDPAGVASEAQELSQRIERVSFVPRGAGVPSDRVIANGAARLASTFDSEFGGFGRAPKFPQPSRLAVLLRYARRTGDPAARVMVTTTLDRMADGGIYDHVGGGFHRYATDARWLVPHFEKMLYDNAQLAALYVEAWQLTGEARYRDVAADVLDYVTREMTAPVGGFYSATDADSPSPDGHDEEGWFFTWTPAELVEVLGADDAALVSLAYGVTERGNFEGRNILHRVKTDAEVARAHRAPLSEISSRLSDARGRLYRARALRPPPLRDDKIIAAWNGLMISAFARAGWAFGEAAYVDAAARAARFVLDRMRDDEGRLVRTFRDGKRADASFLDDYAFMVAACIDLYEATGRLEWLDAAVRLQEEQDARFSDVDGGYYLTPSDGESLLVREKPTYDGAVPSGNSVSAENLLRLHDFTADSRFRDAAERLFAALSSRVGRAPTGAPRLLVALDRYYDRALEVVIVTTDPAKPSGALDARLRQAYLPNKVSLVLTETDVASQASTVPWLEAKRAMNGVATAYVCERGRCELPTSKPSVLARQLSKVVPYPAFADSPPPPLVVGGAFR
jgi:uncharacterized protein YyaL (SSP411 family)